MPISGRTALRFPSRTVTYACPSFAPCPCRRRRSNLALTAIDEKLRFPCHPPFLADLSNALWLLAAIIAAGVPLFDRPSLEPDLSFDPFSCEFRKRRHTGRMLPCLVRVSHEVPETRPRLPKSYVEFPINTSFQVTTDFQQVLRKALPSARSSQAHERASDWLVPPRKHKPPIGNRRDTRAEFTALMVELALDPADVFGRGPVQAEAPDLQGRHLKRKKGAPPRFDFGEKHQRQIAPKFLVARDSFVIIEEIAAAMKDEAIAINLDFLSDDGRNGNAGQRWARRRSSDARNICLRSNLIAPVRPVVHRKHDDVVTLDLRATFRPNEERDAGFGQIRQQRNAGVIVSRPSSSARRWRRKHRKKPRRVLCREFRRQLAPRPPPGGGRPRPFLCSGVRACQAFPTNPHGPNPGHGCWRARQQSTPADVRQPAFSGAHSVIYALGK